ncbi:MAG: N-acetyltransferase family protein [Minwuia sp.]|uniref:GNAT family N-acetyltransferase n=1 Tax=Minwuia sp. TaxID=2493630 RepID=UPI003A88EE2E
MAEFTVRRARTEDAEGVAQMFNGLDLEDLSDEALCPFTAEIVLRDAIGDGALLATEVAVTASGEVIGAAAHNLAYHAETAHPARWLEMLFVAKDWRRHGVARALMAAVAREALDSGCDAVFWGVRRFNDGGARFYDSIGAGNEDADIRVLMGRALSDVSGG